MEKLTPLQEKFTAAVQQSFESRRQINLDNVINFLHRDPLIIPLPLDDDHRIAAVSLQRHGVEAFNGGWKEKDIQLAVKGPVEVRLTHFDPPHKELPDNGQPCPQSTVILRDNEMHYIDSKTGASLVSPAPKGIKISPNCEVEFYKNGGSSTGELITTWSIRKGLLSQNGSLE